MFVVVVAVVVNIVVVVALIMISVINWTLNTKNQSAFYFILADIASLVNAAKFSPS